MEMNAFLLIITILACMGNGIISGTLSRRFARNPQDLYLFNFISSLCCMIVLLAAAGISGAPLPSLYTLGMGGLFGVVTVLSASGCCGLVGIMQKVHQSSVHQGELMYFLITAFLIAAVFSGWRAFAGHKKHGEDEGYEKHERHKMCPSLRSKSMLLMLLASMVIFREKLTRTRWVGFGIGCVAIGMLCIG